MSNVNVIRNAPWCKSFGFFCEINIFPARIECIPRCVPLKGSWLKWIAFFFSKIKTFSPFISKSLFLLPFWIRSFITKKIRNSLYIHQYVWFVSTCEHVCSRKNAGRKIRENIGKISVSDRVGVNRSRISKRTRCKFPCCNLVSHLIRLTIFCFHCILTGEKDCESYLSVLTLPSLNSGYVRNWGFNAQ